MHNDPLLGQQLGGRYQILEKAADEMLGRVYKARDAQEHHLVHVKVLHPYLAGNPEKVRRFAREITATSVIRHPNTVDVLDYGEVGDQHFFVMEFVRARSLHEELEKGPVSIDRAVHIAAQIAGALDAAHAQGVVHRNLSPHNILLLENADQDYVKVRDFGLSKLEDAEDLGQGLTATGARIGNTSYMAPEYIEDSEVTPQVDLYALGCLLFHMVTGRPPFEGKSGQVLMMHISNLPDVPSQLQPEIPPWLDRIILHLLEKEPRRRPHRGRMVAGALEQGIGRSLEPPPLHRIDANGEIVRSAFSRKGGSQNGKTTLVAGSAAAMVGLGLAGVAVLALALGIGWYFLAT